jgi:hypothetical protein
MSESPHRCLICQADRWLSSVEFKGEQHWWCGKCGVRAVQWLATRASPEAIAKEFGFTPAQLQLLIQVNNENQKRMWEMS